MNKILMNALCVVTAATLLAQQAGAANPGYHLLKEIPVGDEGGWDYLSVDSAAHRLYVTHQNEVVVINLDTEAVAGKITGLSGVHGFAIASELGRGFASNGRDASVSIVDLKTLAVTGKVSTGKNPDAVLYEPTRQEVYAFNGRSNSATVFAAQSAQVVATIALPGKPEFSVADAAAKRVYVNIEDRNEVAVLDITTHTLVAEWPIAPGESASGMAFDAKNHRLFLGCDNQKMIMLDTATGKVITSVPIGHGVDANAFDASTQLAFSSNGEGTVTVAHEDAPNQLSVVQTLDTQAGSRTMTLDPNTHNIYLSAATRSVSNLPTDGAITQRFSYVPGSFKVLVYGMTK
jgi:YVTN family beta-propeller protein